jgi:putative Mg2+ transporter-C (MgtC) family protein
VPDIGFETELLWRLALALALCSAVGLERESRGRSAGIRTHALVGVGAALFTLVSKYGFGDSGNALDSSRVAAQVVSGIGFIGGGLIFVRRDAVRGLTTAAVVWFTAAIGMACGAGLPVLAIGATAVHFTIVSGYPPLLRRLRLSPHAPSSIWLVYEDGRGVLRRAIEACTARQFHIAHLSVQRPDTEHHPGPGLVGVTLEVAGRASVIDLATTLQGIDGMREVTTGESDGV